MTVAKTASELAADSMAYFPHDANAASDIKCQRLIMRLGFEGYGRWWRLCEHLATIKGHAIPFDTNEDKLILAQVVGFGVGAFDDFMSIEEVSNFVNTLVSIGLLERSENGLLESKRMHENAMYFGRQRHNGAKGGRPRKSASSNKNAGQQ